MKIFWTLVIKKGESLFNEINQLKEYNSKNYDKFSVKIENKNIVLYGELQNEVKVLGTGGSFDYYELGEPLFIGDNNEYLNETIGITKIRQYIWYSETRTSLIAQAEEDSSYYLGIKDQTTYYFIYESNEITTLDHDFLSTINVRAEQYVIYADNCLLSKEIMVRHNIIFKKIPRDITRF